MTLLEITNRVLKRLRETQVASLVTDDYALLVADFVAQVYEEVGQQHDWSAFYGVTEFDCVVGQTTYDLTATTPTGDVVVGTMVTNEKSEPVVTPKTGWSGYIYEDEDSRYPRAEIWLTEPSYLRRRQLEDRNTNNLPCYITFSMKPNGEGLLAEIHPKPNQPYRVRLPMFTPPDPILADAGDDNVELILPWRVIFAGALMLTLNERGEEIGEPGNLAEQKYYDLLSKAIEADNRTREVTNRYDWIRN